MAAVKPLMPAKMRSMAATAAAELAALSSVAITGVRQKLTSRSHTAALVTDLEHRIGRCAIISLSFSPDSSLLIAGTADWRLAGWLVVTPKLSLSAPTTLTLVRAFELSGAHTGAIHSVGVLGDGTVLYSSGADGNLRLWQTSKLLPVNAITDADAIESETAPGTYHPASITQTAVAGGALLHVSDDPRGGCLVSSHERYRSLFDFGLTAMPFGAPKNPSEMSNAAAVDAAITMFGHSGAPRSISSFRLASVPPKRLAADPPAAISPRRGTQSDGYREGMPSSRAKPSISSPRPVGVEVSSTKPALDERVPSPSLSPRRSPDPEGSPAAAAAPFSPPRTAAAKASDLAAATVAGLGRLSPVRSPSPAAAEASDSDDNDLVPASSWRPLRVNSLEGGTADGGASSVDEPLVSGLDGDSGAGSESWWEGNTDPATWRDLEPTAVPQALLQGLVDLIDGKRSRMPDPSIPQQSPSPPREQTQPQTLLQASTGPGTEIRIGLRPMEPTRIVRVRRACLDVAPLPASSAEVRSRRSRPPVQSGTQVQNQPLASYTRSSFAWDAFASRILYCAGSEVTLHDATSGKQLFLRIRSWADMQNDAATEQQRRDAAAAGNAGALLMMAASPHARRGSSCSGTPAAVAAAASRRRRIPRCTVISLSEDGLRLLVGLSDCSIGLWQRASVARDAPWEQTAVLLPPWVRRHESNAAAATSAPAAPGAGPRVSTLRRASLVGSAKIAFGFSSIGTSGVLVDASFGPSGLFIAATYVKHASGGARSFRVLVAFWEVADVMQVGQRSDCGCSFCPFELLPSIAFSFM